MRRSTAVWTVALFTSACAAGSAESLNNLILALLIAIPAALVGTIGAFRASRRPTAA